MWTRRCPAGLGEEILGQKPKSARAQIQAPSRSVAGARVLGFKVAAKNFEGTPRRESPPPNSPFPPTGDNRKLLMLAFATSRIELSCEFIAGPSSNSRLKWRSICRIHERFEWRTALHPCVHGDEERSRVVSRVKAWGCVTTEMKNEDASICPKVPRLFLIHFRNLLLPPSFLRLDTEVWFHDVALSVRSEYEWLFFFGWFCRFARLQDWSLGSNCKAEEVAAGLTAKRS